MLSKHPRIRLGLYLAAVACNFIAPFVAVSSPDYGAAFITGAGILNVAALGTAASNIRQPHEE
ncbi:hypothetical protein [Microbacterium sp. T2.11-28]|uniref:hypothetical protein n=1 Tax=Microbacterium sp. T2.11-28 TaxID=3041169 RepID=UPI0024776077|nr:hypothetical protein [Microbacterium sp. T2.11-28]CAI9386095.1 hypothetical protein MICABA_00175 [Microbacterium sp. T2.11-28]